MVDSYQLVLGVIAVSIMIAAPLGCVVLFDLAAGRWDARIAKLRNRANESLEHRRNVRALRHQQGMPLEQLACDLRRLRAAVGSDEHRSAAHQIGNRLAYDRVLMQICAMLQIEHDLTDRLVGLERDIERLRIEAELERAGLIISNPRRFGQAA